MKNITDFYLKILKILEEKFSIYLNRHVFVMIFVRLFKTNGRKSTKYMYIKLVFLTLPALQTQTDTFANSVDPDEMSQNVLSHQDLHCLLFYF